MPVGNCSDLLWLAVWLRIVELTDLPASDCKILGGGLLCFLPFTATLWIFLHEVFLIQVIDGGTQELKECES